MSDERRVGRVMRVDTRGFVTGCEELEHGIPVFGSFVRAKGVEPDSAIYGLVYDVGAADDLFARLFVRSNVPEEVIQDHRRNRQVPIEVSVLAIGCGDKERVHHCLPPQPPVMLDWLYECTDDEVRAFTSRLDFLRLVIEARDVPVDELLAASLRAAAGARPENERERFLLDAGRQLARLLANDPVRLEGLLHRLQTE